MKHHILQHLPVSTAAPVSRHTLLLCWSASATCMLLAVYYGACSKCCCKYLCCPTIGAACCSLCTLEGLFKVLLQALILLGNWRFTQPTHGGIHDGRVHVVVMLQGQQRAEACFVNSVYLDNSSLELYHGLLDKKPGATTMRIRCRLVPPLRDMKM